MMKLIARWKYVLSFATVVLAFVGGVEFAAATSVEQTSTAPAYLIVSSRVLDAEAMEPYRKSAGPLARKAGLEIVAGRPNPSVTVLEGIWPYDEGILIEKFRSMAALKDFRYSDGYQQAKTLREGALKVNFIVAVEGVATH